MFLLITCIQEESVPEKLMPFQQYPNSSGSDAVKKVSLDMPKVSKFPPVSGSRRISIYPIQDPILEEDSIEQDTEHTEGT